jgi:dihydrofolate reductase
MGKVIVEQIISLDGYAEDADGSIDFFGNANWINEADTEQWRTLSGVVAIVFGAKTYRMFADYWPFADPVAEPVATRIDELPKFVVSSVLETAPWGTNDSAELLRGDGVTAVRDLRHRFAGDLIVWGSLSLSDALLRAGEVDVLRLRILPLLLGRGRPFCPPDLGLRRLSLAAAQSFAGGLVVLEYNATPQPADARAPGSPTVGSNGPASQLA